MFADSLHELRCRSWHRSCNGSGTSAGGRALLPRFGAQGGGDGLVYCGVVFGVVFGCGTQVPGPVTRGLAGRFVTSQDRPHPVANNTRFPGAQAVCAPCGAGLACVLPSSDPRAEDLRRPGQVRRHGLPSRDQCAGTTPKQVLVRPLTRHSRYVFRGPIPESHYRQGRSKKMFTADQMRGLPTSSGPPTTPEGRHGSSACIHMVSGYAVLSIRNPLAATKPWSRWRSCWTSCSRMRRAAPTTTVKLIISRAVGGDRDVAYAERLSIADETWKIASQSALELVQEPFVVAAREVQFPYQLDIQRRLLG